jgi:arginine/serine-rich splicing factor 12
LLDACGVQAYCAFMLAQKSTTWLAACPFRGVFRELAGKRCGLSTSVLHIALAGTPAIVTVTARDANRRRITQGGDEVSVTVHPGLGCGKDAAPITADITDRGDGSYVAKFTVPVKGNWTIRVEVEGIEVDGSPFPVFFGAPGSLDVKEAEKAAEEAVAAAAAPGGAAGGAASTPALEAATAAAAAAAAAAAPKVISSTLGSAPFATPASIAAAAAGNPLAAAAAAAAAFSMPNAALGLAAAAPPPNPMAAAMASAAAAAAAGATFVNPLAANPLHQQLALQLLSAKLSPDAHLRCVVVTHFPPGLDAAALRALMGVAGSVVDVALAGAPGERLLQQE